MRGIESRIRVHAQGAQEETYQKATARVVGRLAHQDDVRRPRACPLRPAVLPDARDERHTLEPFYEALR